MVRIGGGPTRRHVRRAFDAPAATRKPILED
jgi:hypothetical protein